MSADSTPTDVLNGSTQWCVAHGDCLETMGSLPDCCVDAVVTDAPYGLSKITTKVVVEALECWLRGEPYKKKRRGFMGRTWDRFVPGPEVWRECFRAMKPGGYLLTFAGTRTEDLMGMACRLAGFERVDTLAWIHSQGMSKSVNMERAIAMHQCTLPGRHYASTLPNGTKAREGDHLCPETEESLKWKGQGTGLAPSHEPILVFRKPIEGTNAANALKYGTAMNIDACRIAHASEEDFEKHSAGVEAIKRRGGKMDGSWKNFNDLSGANEVSIDGRWPKNTALQHDPKCRIVGTTQVGANPTWDTPNRDTEPSAFTGDRVSKVRHGRQGEPSAERRYTEAGATSFAATPGARRDAVEDVPVYECVEECPVRILEDQAEGTARYFQQLHFYELDAPFLYQAKPSALEKERGLEHFAGRSGDDGRRNVHPTSKSVELCRWLTKLVARPGQVVLNPFAGGGSEGVAAVLEGCRWIGCELMDTDDEPFVSIAKARLTHLDGGSYVPRESLRRAQDSAPAQTSLFGRGG
jgi:DNA modification methylase